LIKGGVHLENLGKIKVVAFDKTGTLTKGQPVVTDILGLDGTEEEILKMAYSVEHFSEHPLAKAIVRKAKDAGEKNSATTDFRSLAGYGAQAKIVNKTICVGSPRLFHKLGQDIYSNPQIETLKNEGKTVILVGTEEMVTGIIALRDEIRPQAQGVVEQLHSMGIKVVMLTGDNEVTAQAIAKEIGIDEVRAGLKPEDKINSIVELEHKYGAVAMVGDGINDAPALARSTVGIAMGAVGTDAAIEAADTALMADDIGKVPFTIKLGKRARKISTQNVIFSLLILTVLIPTSLIGMMSVAMAVFFHESSELLAVANGLRVGKN